jgi:hypothetical protein
MNPESQRAHEATMAAIISGEDELDAARRRDFAAQDMATNLKACGPSTHPADADVQKALREDMQENIADCGSYILTAARALEKATVCLVKLQEQANRKEG